MSIKETLKQIAQLARFYKIDKPYMVGGLPRDIYLHQKIKTADIDLTTNSPDVLRLGVLVADHLNVPFELSDDGHITVFADEFDIDFSSNFISEKVFEYLTEDKKKYAEAYSRDFTINALHQDLETGKFFDPTGMSVQDISDKIIRTPVPPEITLTDDPRRAYRAVNLAVRYGFTIDESVASFIRNNKELFSSKNIKDKYIILKVNKAISLDPDLTLKLLKDLSLFDNVPLVGRFKEVLIEKKMLVDYFNASNFQKGASLVAKNWEEYINQGPEYKAIKDFWENNYDSFDSYSSPNFHSWTKWYMDKFRSDWNYQHKDPVEVLKIMKNEIDSKENFKLIPDLKLFDFSKNRKNNVEKNYSKDVRKAKNADINNLTEDVKSFIKVLGETAKELGAETPFITSGYRSIEHQARVMFHNWQKNGGLESGRAYLENLYGQEYGKAVADVFEQYQGSPQAISAIIPIVQKFGGKHTESPARAIDLRLTRGIDTVLNKIKDSGRFEMKIVDETRMAGPHWHVTIYADNKRNNRLARIDSRRVVLNKIAANTISKIEE